MNIQNRLQAIDKQVSDTRACYYVQTLLTDATRNQNYYDYAIAFANDDEFFGYSCSYIESIKELCEEIQEELDMGIYFDDAIAGFVTDDACATLEGTCEGLLKALHNALGCNYFTLHLEYQILAHIPVGVEEIDKAKLDRILESVEGMYGCTVRETWTAIKTVFEFAFDYRLDIN